MHSQTLQRAQSKSTKFIAPNLKSSEEFRDNSHRAAGSISINKTNRPLQGPTRNYPVDRVAPCPLVGSFPSLSRWLVGKRDAAISNAHSLGKGRPRWVSRYRQILPPRTLIPNEIQFHISSWLFIHLVGGQMKMDLKLKHLLRKIHQQIYLYCLLQLITLAKTLQDKNEPEVRPFRFNSTYEHICMAKTS